MHVNIIWTPYNYVQVIFKDNDDNIVDELLIPRELDVDQVINERLKALT